MNKKLISITAAAFALFLGACGSGGSGAADDSQKVTVGVVSEVEREVWEDVKKRLADEDIDLSIQQFDNYTQPNLALADGDLDLNAFQHVAFLEKFNADNGADLVPIGFTYVSPLGLYSEKVTDYEALPEGAEIVIPNDVTNGGRALLLLQSLDLIELDPAAGTEPTVSDIKENPKKLVITELDASQTARSLQDVDAAIVNTNFAIDAGLVPNEDALFLDTDKIADVSEIYKNVIAARKDDADKEVYKKVVEAYQSKETADLINQFSEGNDVAAWE